MAMARHDSCQYPQHVRQHAGLVRFGQMNVSQMSVGQLGKRKRPGSGSSLASTSAVAQGHYHDSLTSVSLCSTWLMGLIFFWLSVLIDACSFTIVSEVQT